MSSVTEVSSVTERKLRADTQRTRDRLLDTMGRLLEENGLDFSLPDLARESGVATATVYRHFSDLGDLRQEFYNRFVTSLVQELAALSAHCSGRELLRATCRTWVSSTLPWARAATLIRSAEGYLERVRNADPFVIHLHQGVLLPLLDQLVEQGVVPDLDRGYAALVWVSLFDERVFIDLTVTFGWSPEQIGDMLESTLLGALRTTDLDATT